MTTKASFIQTAQWTQGQVTNKHLEELDPEIKQLPSSNPEMTEAVFKANFEKLDPWLSEQGWAKKELKFVKKFLKFTSGYCVDQEPAVHVGYQLLKQSIEKKNVDVFEITPKSALRYFADLAEIVDVLKEKGEDPAYKKMLEIIRGVINPTRFEFLMKTEPMDKTNRLARRVIEDMKVG